MFSVVIRPLPIGHRHEDIVVDALGQLVENLGLVAANQDRLQRLAQSVEVLVADDLADLVADLMFVQQAKRRAEAEAIDKLHDRDQLFEAILERRPGKDDGVWRGDALDAAGGAGGPVLDALRFIEDDEVGPPRPDQVEVAVDGVVVGDLEESVRLEERFAPLAADRR